MGGQKEEGQVDVPGEVKDKQEGVAPDVTEMVKADGVTVQGHSPEAMVAEELRQVDGEKQAEPMFFVEPADRFRVEVDILYGKDGRIQSVSSKNLGVDFSDLKTIKHAVEWFEFSIPGYDDVATYRQRSSIWNAQAGMLIVSRPQFRNFLLAWHLRDWSLRDRDGKKLPLSSNDSGRLDDASLKLVRSIQPPTLVDVVMTIFEKDALLSATTV
jgi:hypothetical protein